jgi:hypothetical protein
MSDNPINRDLKRAEKWARMLVSPSDHLDRAPSSTPFLASKARFVRSLDVPYASTDNGYFTVAAFPNAQNAYALSTTPAAFPPAPVALSLTSISHAHTDLNSSYLSNAICAISDANTGVALGTAPFQDLGVLDATLSGVNGIRITTYQNTNYSFNVRLNSSLITAMYLRLGRVNPDFTITYSSALAAYTNPTLALNNGAGVTGIAYVIQMVGNTVAPITNKSDTLFSIYANLLSAQIPAGLNGTTSFNLVASELAETGRVTHQRCTAMSMLVTNMSSALNNGGEIVIGRVPAATIASGVPSTIMTTIKQLPEERYWRSGAIKDGGYSWWLPDDLASYEPTPVASPQIPENILVASCKIVPDGIVRVILTYCFEFYTPVQLFARDYNFIYNAATQQIWQELSQRSAVSANAGHIALAMSIITGITKLLSFYSDNKEKIDPMLKQARKVVQRNIPSQNEKQKQKQNPPPLPPRPSK